MARIVPDPLIGSVSPEVHRVYRQLKAIPGDDIACWMCLPLPGSDARPEFLVLHRETTAFLLSVATTSQADADEAVHGGLFSRGSAAPTDLGLPHRTLMKEFLATVVGAPTSTGLAERAVYSLVLFPNVNHATLKHAFPENPHEDAYWLGSDYITANGLFQSFERLASGTLTNPVLAVLRSCFTPESVMPHRFSPRRRLQRNVQPVITPMLLDYDQEWWVKHRLALPEEAMSVAEEPVSRGGDAALVTGVAGSGKSLVLLFRACNQARLQPTSRSLILTHNRALRHELEARFGELGAPPNVEWNTFFGWADRWLAGIRSNPSILQYEARDDAVCVAAEPVFGRIEPRQVEFLRDEIDWMKDRAIGTIPDYLGADRVGRGVRLDDAQRRKVFRVFERYETLLKERGAEDWSGRALRFWRLVEGNTITPGPYDFIYVDEAQFFAPVWFRTVRRALSPDIGRLFLAADPTQGFLKRRQSWLACGLDLRGRSTRLRRSYRNTRQILEFAAAFYRQRVAEEDEELNLPGEEALTSAPDGEEPHILTVTSRQDEVTRVANEVQAFVSNGGNPSDVLVLSAQGSRNLEARTALAGVLGAARVTNARDTARLGAVRVCGLDAGTGLEAPIVFLIGVADLLAAEDDLQRSQDQRVELRRDNTRRLYMAFTRAAQRLVVTWVGEPPASLTTAATHDPKEAATTH